MNRAEILGKKALDNCYCDCSNIKCENSGKIDCNCEGTNYSGSLSNIARI